MFSKITVSQLRTQADWDALKASLGVAGRNHLLGSLLANLQQAGAVGVVRESAYIDRDFSAAYASFYSTLFRPILKYCSRIHFFRSDLADLMASSPDAEKMSRALEAENENYLGYIIIRPLDHAPISSAVVSSKYLISSQSKDISVKSPFGVHVMGASLEVIGMPLTQQDTRIGACAQATIWMAARHFHNRHSAAWYSVPDITEAALKPTDSALTRSLPAGSDYLTCDNMVRAFRAIGQHPVVYAPNMVNGVLVWSSPTPREIISRYADSGIPVVLGLQSAGAAVGHGVVAVGVERDSDMDVATFGPKPTPADFLTHVLVNDDQRGAYCRLPIKAVDQTGEYPFCLETDVAFIMVPLPSKVYMTAEIAETIARDVMKTLANRKTFFVEAALPAEDAAKWDEDPDFYIASLADTLVARTYLTFGWKYKARMLRNSVSDRLKSELIERELPKYVWVTEFSQPAESLNDDPCKRRVRGHVVLDATGSRFWESKLFVDAPGILLAWGFDPQNPAAGSQMVLNVTTGASTYWPKIRSEMDYATCLVAS